MVSEDAVMNIINNKNISIDFLDEKSLDNVSEYIKDNYSESLTIDELCHIACMGRTKFKTLFKLYFGCTVTEYIRRIRIEQAKALLEDTGLPIIEVAYMVGYNNSGRFSKIFLEDTGTYPSQFRAAHN